MKDIFGPQQPIDDSSNFWRSLFALSAIVLTVGASLVYYHVYTADDLSEIAAVFDLLPIVRLVQVPETEAGGDVEIAPPQPEPTPLPTFIGDVLLDPSVFSATNILVKDVETGMVLFAKNEYEPHSIASLTKLMSALVILEKQPDWTATAAVVADTLIDTHMYAGDTYTLGELWDATLIGSSNKAILTLSDAVGWPREAFVARMNQKAQELGMSDTYFNEPTGLSAENVSSASDLAILLDEALRHERIRESMLKQELTLYSAERKKEHHMWSTNWILLGWIPNKLPKFLGGKTGYIDASGYNFVMQTANADDHVIDVIVLGTEGHEDRFTEARDVAQWVFENYTWPEKSQE